jgi:hypothetical protein
MKGGRRYSIGAGVVAFYVGGIVLGSVAGLYVAVTRRPVPLWEPFLAMGLVLTLVLVYHSRVARKVSLRTPGEMMMGCVVVDGLKQWTNPYGINRAALFAVLFIALVGAGSLWDSVADERFYASLTLPVVVGRIVYLGCLLAGVVMVGRAQPAGGILVAAYFALAGIVNLLAEPPAGVSVNVTRSLGLSGVLMALVAGVILFRYQRAAANKAMQPPGAAGQTQ